MLEDPTCIKSILNELDNLKDYFSQKINDAKI